MEIIKTTALITINDTLWVQLVLFLAFLFLINRIMFRPVQRNLLEREAGFLALRQDIHLLKKEIKALSDAVDAEEDRHRNATRRAADALREEGLEEANALMNEALDDIRALRQGTEAQLNASLASARQQIAQESERLAVAIIQSILTRRTAP